jgi:hypothetical protein
LCGGKHARKPQTARCAQNQKRGGNPNQLHGPLRHQVQFSLERP